MLGLLAAACAGSGSSGFDISPSGESAAIAAALEQSRCVESGALSVCPADEVPRDTPANLPDSARIDTGVAGSEALACLPSDAAAGCDLVVPFAPQGFPAGAEFRVAVRDPDDGAQWHIGAEAERNGSPDAPSFDATVPLGPSEGQASPPANVQLVILVFLEPPPVVPTAVELLADSGADFAFVTPEFPLTASGF